MPLKKTFKIDDDIQYRIQLAERVEVLGVKLAPGQQDIVVSGAVLKTIADKVEDAEPV
jgi:ligand-binding SRPBCC domain-containing protein